MSGSTSFRFGWAHDKWTLGSLWIDLCVGMKPLKWGACQNTEHTSICRHISVIFLLASWWTKPVNVPNAFSLQMLATSDDFSINQCFLPNEGTVIWIYILGGFFILIVTVILPRHFGNHVTRYSWQFLNMVDICLYKIWHSVWVSLVKGESIVHFILWIVKCFLFTFSFTRIQNKISQFEYRM